jgi:type IV fimbrial biogenesis protein FimT
MKRAQPGFTLLELMVVLAIAGVLMAVGIPAMSDFIRNSRITSAANDVMAGLHFARSESIKRRVPVTLCTSDAPLVANPACADASAPWGWITFVDLNQSGTFDAGEILLQQREPINAQISVGSSTVPFSVTYLLNGFALDPNASQLVLCDARGNVASAGELSSARGILIAVTGRAGVTRDIDDIQDLVDAIGADVGGCEA